MGVSNMYDFFKLPPPPMTPEGYAEFYKARAKMEVEAGKWIIATYKAHGLGAVLRPGADLDMVYWLACRASNCNGDDFGSFSADWHAVYAFDHEANRWGLKQ